MFSAWKMAEPYSSEGIKGARLNVLENRKWYNSMKLDALVEKEAAIRIIIR